jgi:hypothetical protein
MFTIIVIALQGTEKEEIIPPPHGVGMRDMGN